MDEISTFVWWEGVVYAYDAMDAQPCVSFLHLVYTACDIAGNNSMSLVLRKHSAKHAKGNAEYAYGNSICRQVLSTESAR